MNILFDNVDLTSQSGPNSFARKLKTSLENEPFWLKVQEGIQHIEII